jgi:hypothetical protein
MNSGPLHVHHAGKQSGSLTVQENVFDFIEMAACCHRLLPSLQRT